MYPHNSKQLQFENFNLPFEGKLRSDNRWVRLAKFIPWQEFEQEYSKTLTQSGKGPPAMSVRVAIGALIIKERLGTSDEETVEQIRENPYLQYFLGFKQYVDDQPFDPSMFVHFRKRICQQLISKINEAVSKKLLLAANGCDKDDSDKTARTGGSNSKETENDNKGKLLIDATCSPADITFPTDLKLLNAARQISERIIDVLHRPHKGKMKKPRTYRKIARKEFLAVAKSKRTSKSKLRKAVGKQLRYLARNLKTIDKLSTISSLLLLKKHQYKLLLVIHELYRQQKWMYDHRENRVDDRIVSIFQPHVRPIKRGKAGASTEFGAKLSVSLVDGVAFLDHLSWDNFNESGVLKAQIKSYRKRFGVYPASLHVDKIYRNRDTIKYCKKHGIRLSGPALGRPPKNVEKQRNQQKQARKDERDRIPIEGKFGQGKRRYSLSKIMCKLAETSQTAIAVVFLVMNLDKLLRATTFYLFYFYLLPREPKNSQLSDNPGDYRAVFSQLSFSLQ